MVGKGTFPLQVEVEGFSGPLDLLCYLVESRQFQATQIRVSDLVRIYGSYLARSQKTSLYVIAEFLSLAAGLVLEKVLALLPEQEQDDSLSCSESEEEPLSEEELLQQLSRYRPYRRVSFWLMERKEYRDRFFRRMLLEEAPVYDVGDLYSLCRLWWEMLASHQKEESLQAALRGRIVEGWQGIPSAVPEKVQIDKKIEELSTYLRDHASLSLSVVLEKTSSVSVVVVTLLALLEMSRTGKIDLFQKELFGDVVISCQTN